MYRVFIRLINHYRKLIPEYFPPAENPEPVEATTGAVDSGEEASPLKD